MHAGFFCTFFHTRFPVHSADSGSKPMPSSTVENYLKAIWSLQKKGEPTALVPIGRVAEKLSVTPGTATTMMNQLRKQELVDYMPRKGVSLNEHGRKAAMLVLRRHRLVETFLVEIMKIDWAEVHEDAEILEHVISDRLLSRMDEMLGHPTHDPHGAPIPTPDGKINFDLTQPLAECQLGVYTLIRVQENRPDFLQWLEKIGLKPGISFRLQSLDPFADTMGLEISQGGLEIQLSMSAAQSLLVHPKE